MYRFTAKLTKLARNWSGFFPDLPGTAATGATREELIQNLRGVLIMHLHAMERDGDPIPASAYDSAVIEVSGEEVTSFVSDPLPTDSATA
jgi:predicted RNase H-like HicB family nuclease